MHKITKGFCLSTIGVGFGLADMLLIMGSLSPHGSREGVPLLSLALLLSPGVTV